MNVRTTYAGRGLAYLAACVLAAWAAGAAADASCSTFSFHLRAEPSFHANSTIVIEGKPGSASVSIEIDSNRSGKSTERLALAPDVAREFCRNMRRIAKMEQPPIEARILDGCPVSGRFRVPGAEEFGFSSNMPTPMSLPRDFAAVDAVLATLEKTDPSCKLANYLELLARYFDFGLTTARIVSQNPATLRLYGTLSAESMTKLDQLLAAFPAEEPVRIDMTNVWIMARSLYPRFQRLLERGDSVTWMATEPDIAKDLEAIGVKRSRIEMVAWPYCSEERPRFERGGKPDRK